VLPPPLDRRRIEFPDILRVFADGPVARKPADARRIEDGHARPAPPVAVGGVHRGLPLPLETAETRYARESVNTATPEQAFEKQWALTLLETVLSQLRTDYEQDGRGRLFEALKPCLLGSRELQPYAELAAALKMSEGAVKVAVHRLRERYRERLKAEIANTVASPADVAAELRHLFRVLGRTG